MTKNVINKEELVDSLGRKKRPKSKIPYSISMPIALAERLKKVSKQMKAKNNSTLIVLAVEKFVSDYEGQDGRGS